MKFRSLTFICWFAVAATASAQGGNVFGPAVREGDSGWEWRANAAFDADSDWSWATRLHYQHVFNDALRLRGVAQFDLDGVDGVQPDFFRAELLWQYQEETATGYQAAVRVEGRLNYRGPHRLGIRWGHQWVPAEPWQVRVNLNAEQEVGAGAKTGIRLSHRMRISRTLVGDVRGGMEAFGRFGNLSDGIRSFDRQHHTAGPALFGPFNDQWGWHVTSQWALTDTVSDMPLRVRVDYRF